MQIRLFLQFRAPFRLLIRTVMIEIKISKNLLFKVFVTRVDEICNKLID